MTHASIEYWSDGDLELAPIYVAADSCAFHELLVTLSHGMWSRYNALYWTRVWSEAVLAYIVAFISIGYIRASLLEKSCELMQQTF